MPESLAILAGLLAGLAVLALAAPVPPPPPRALHRLLRRCAAHEIVLAAEVGLAPAQLVALQLVPGVAGALAAELVGGLPVLALAGGVAATGMVRLALRVRSGVRARRRQDAVLDAVRMLRGLLEAGGTGVQDALAVLARRGPAALRAEFAGIVAASRRGSQVRAWAEARDRIADPVFDLLSVALLAQRPSGGSLAPLLADLEESVAAIYEVAREAEALQVQARSAAGLVVLLPIAFLLVLSAFRSPYLDAYHTLNGAVFLAVMLSTVGTAYLWILRWLRLPREPRLELA